MRLPAASLLLAGLLLLSGCVWLRLLSLKDQFADFDRWIEVPPGPGLELRFRRPVLLAEDLETLVTGRPTASASGGDVTVQSYAFSRIPSPDGPDPLGSSPTLVLLVGIRSGKVAFVSLPPEVFRVVPRELALRGMRALGRAAVDTGSRSAVAAVDFHGTRTVLPTRAELIALFGTPNSVKLMNDRERVLWRYQLQGDSLRADGKPVVAAMAFAFAPGAGHPNRFQVNISGMWLYLDLPQADPPAEHQAGPPGPPPLPAPAAPDPPAALPAAR
jgi:hypothetical protein